MNNVEKIDFDKLESSVIEIIEKNGTPIEFEFQINRGVVSDTNDDTHYGKILTNEDTKKMVENFRDLDIIPLTSNGWVSVDVSSRTVTVEY